ncbi:hypothetical protein RRG08_055505 [Elysia crispata]|uniref:Uncharacterized protein n=1 Tax=Elysia crispata TaxID=231223 RepID=A0AAE1AH37_9GAST|nr:hypothetical protein RRG08_055505 [Elysia crispata]
MEACGPTGVTSLELDRAELSDTIRGQMSSVLAMAMAYKMRLATAPDSSRLVLQSLLPSSSVTASAGTSHGEGFPDSHQTDVGSPARSTEKLGGRRYSGAQPSQAGETAEAVATHTDQLLQMFSSTLQTSSRQSDLAAVLEAGAEAGGAGPGALASKGGMRRQGSVPVLSSLAHQTGSLVHGYLAHRSSSSSLYSVSESSGNNSVALPSQNSPSSNTVVAEATSSGALEKAGVLTPAESNTFPADSSVDSTDTSSTKSKGFGILNRTRRFGAWLGKVTHGEKMEVSKKDLNVFAPTSF